jgi:predicted regulator of Ras-like GTPase activity (Roadblock/LC7/MglB family)
MMFKFLKRIFGRDGATAVSAVAAVPVAAPRAVEKPTGGGVEVASLSLRAILEKLPTELRAIVNQMPEPGVKIMLPVNTIMKQLPAGAVRMSLASLLRQAPPGTFRKTDIEEKQMVDVPLAEVFKNVNAKRLGLRSDQRRYDVPDDAAGLFGKTGHSRSVNGGGGSGIAEPPPPRTASAKPAMPAAPAAPDPQPEPAKIIKMPGIEPAAPAPVAAAAPSPKTAKPNGQAPAPKPQPAASASKDGELVISFVELAAGWPEGIRNELSMLPGETKLVIPATAVSAGLQKGKVVFPWSQVRMWMRPGLPGSTAIPEDFDLVFPLKIVAPAFVAATGATKRREAAELDHSLPDFFGPTAGKKTEPAQPAPVAPAPVIAPQAEAVEPTPSPAPATLKFTLVREEPAPIAEVVPPAVPAAAPVVHEEPVSSPTELVKRACAFPGVAGAVVALEEGLVVAQKLPDGFSADTFAAFMPQIFGRLEKYTTEMQLGAASEITIHSEHGPCHIARSGKIYFGTLGRPGERLPESLANLTAQLAALNS